MAEKIVGYARVSTEDQNLSLQIRALEAAGCQSICRDHGESGSHFSRSGLKRALRKLSKGDTLVVWRLDRLGRSLSGLVRIMEDLERRGIHFRSIMENIDTSSSGGRLMFHMMAALAEYERAIISDRTRAGMAAARAGGRKLGRPRALTVDQVRAARRAINYGTANRAGLAKKLSVSPRTLQRHIDDLANSERRRVEVAQAD